MRGSIFLGNHDFSRMVSRFGNDHDFREESAKLLSCLLLTMRGTVYIYQGDEIGMTNVAYPSIEDYDDVETINSWKEALAEGKDMDLFLKLVHEKSRDNARTPMQWNREVNAGFTEGDPWIRVNPNYSDINVHDQQSDPNSILNYYRKMISLRKSNPTLVYGNYEDLAPDHPSFFAYRRWDQEHEFVIIMNFSDDEGYWKGLDLAEYDLIESNQAHSNESNHFSAWQSKVFKR